MRDENERRKNDIELFDVPVECDLLLIRERLRKANDEIELRQIWPL